MQFDFRLKKYLNKKAEKDWRLLIKPPQKIYDSFIVVPAKAESKNIPQLLDSISNQNKDCLERCLTIIVINSSSDDSKDVIDNNSQTIKYLSDNVFDFDLSYVDATLPLKNAGVGLSRKIGADLALDYCNESSVICYTDADVILSKDYLETIMDYYRRHDCGWAIVGFKHQKNDEPMIEKSIQEYERFLLKTAKDLKDSGSPYGYVSLGSCMTCTSSGYIAAGGMNRMKATEDFYFLQELTKHFECMNIINKNLVHPSSRISSRVYLGTGYRMKQTSEGFSINELYFSEDSFKNLKEFLQIIKKSYRANLEQLLSETKKINRLNDFLNQQEINKVWDSLIENVDEKKFIAQFHRWFDGLKTIKFLKYYSK